MHTDLGGKSSPVVKRALDANDVDAMQSAMDALPRGIMSVGQSVNGVVRRASPRILPAPKVTVVLRYRRHCRSTASLAPTSTLTSSGDRKGLSDASIPLACADRHCGSATYLLHLPDLERFDAQVLSIGGAGVHDGIFFAGVVAALLT